MDGEDSATSQRGEAECLRVEESMVDLPEVSEVLESVSSNWPADDTERVGGTGGEIVAGRR